MLKITREIIQNQQVKTATKYSLTESHFEHKPLATDFITVDDIAYINNRRENFNFHHIITDTFSLFDPL